MIQVLSILHLFSSQSRAKNMFILARKQLLWFFSFISICLINVTTLAQPFLYYYCENDGNYTADSMYKSNLDTALSAISTTNMGLGFYKISIDKGNEKANSVALCRGDINADVCESCLNDSIALLPRLCPNKKSAIGYYEYCFLRYSNDTILRSTRVKFYTYMANIQNVTDIDGFNNALGPLLKRLREKAAAGGSQQKFASGNTTGPGFSTFYAFVQCTPDLWQQQCSDCLEDAINRISVYFNGKIGGRILLPMCNFRYEAYRFFNHTAQDITLTPVLQSSPPIRSPPPPVTPPITPPAGTRQNLSMKLAIGVGSAILTVIILIIYCILKPPSSNWAAPLKHKTEEDKNIEAFVMHYGSLSTKRFTYSEIKKMTNLFKVKLGEGGFGKVYKGKLSDGRLVAVKLLNSSKANGQEFINEVASIGRTAHVNIVALLGFCFDNKKRALVYEYMPNGSLEKFIFNNVRMGTNEHVGVKELYEIALGIACGLDYLHRGCSTRILHLDIKPHNILLDEDFCPKIADFGLAKLYSRKESIVSMLDARGTIGYIAPEVYNQNFGGVSHKSDVYSYGMLLLEMVGGRRNVDAGIGSGRTSEIYFPDWIYTRIHKDGFLLDSVTTDEENDYARKMTIVGLWCIQPAPNQRPSINVVIEMLEGSMEALKVPPKPFFSSPPRSPATIYSTSESIP